MARLENNLSLLQTNLRKEKPEVVAKRLQNFEERTTGDLAENLHRLRDVSFPAPITSADVPAYLRERFHGKTGKWLLKVFPRESLWEYEPLQNFVQKVQKVDPEATGKPFSTLEGLDALCAGFKWTCLYAFLAMVVILALDFRNVRHTLLALTPLAVGLILTFAISALFGWPLNPANIIALPLILGVGADNGVHILHDYLASRSKGNYALGYATGKGILVAALTTILGFGTLILSRHTGLSSLGRLLAVGVSCCLLTALIGLPALLHLMPRKQETPPQPSESPLRKAG